VGNAAEEEATTVMRKGGREGARRDEGLSVTSHLETLSETLSSIPSLPPSFPPSLPPSPSDLGEWAGSEDEEEGDDAYLIKEDDDLPFACFLCREGEEGRERGRDGGRAEGREGGRWQISVYKHAIIFVTRYPAVLPSLPPSPPQASAIR